jgi:hypothetical protein
VVFLPPAEPGDVEVMAALLEPRLQGEGASSP